MRDGRVLVLLRRRGRGILMMVGRRRGQGLGDGGLVGLGLRLGLEILVGLLVGGEKNRRKEGKRSMRYEKRMKQRCGG
jgi:hypothetical protein